VRKQAATTIEQVPGVWLASLLPIKFTVLLKMITGYVGQDWLGTLQMFVCSNNAIKSLSMHAIAKTPINISQSNIL
jgi:hypothetical protein